MKAGSVILISALTSIATVGACLVAKEYIEKKKAEETETEELAEDIKTETAEITPDDFDLSKLA